MKVCVMKENGKAHIIACGGTDGGLSPTRHHELNMS